MTEPVFQEPVYICQSCKGEIKIMINRNEPYCCENCRKRLAGEPVIPTQS